MKNMQNSKEKCTQNTKQQNDHESLWTAPDLSQLHEWNLLKTYVQYSYEETYSFLKNMLVVGSDSHLNFKFYRYNLYHQKP